MAAAVVVAKLLTPALGTEKPPLVDRVARPVAEQLVRLPPVAVVRPAAQSVAIAVCAARQAAVARVAVAVQIGQPCGAKLPHSASPTRVDAKSDGLHKA